MPAGWVASYGSNWALENFGATSSLPAARASAGIYSRDQRGDCVQVVIALIVTPEGFPLAYEMLPGNTTDKTTLQDFLAKIEKQYGKAERIWIMDRGIPTEETLGQMRASDPPVNYLVGTPKGKLTALEAGLTDMPLPTTDGREIVMARHTQPVPPPNAK